MFFCLGMWMYLKIKNQENFLFEQPCRIYEDVGALKIPTSSNEDLVYDITT